MDHACTLTVAADAVNGAAVLIPDGILDSDTYRFLRDIVIDTALEEPTAVIIDVGRLTVPAETAWTVFTSARWHVGVWPNTPILLVCQDAKRRSALRRQSTRRQIGRQAA